MSAAMRACSGGNVPLGGGTSAQKKYGIEDSPDLVFQDLTDWSVVQPNGFPDYRYNDREIIRAFADNNVATFDFLLAHGVVFVDKPPDRRGGIVGRQLGAAHDACRRHGLAADPDRRAGRSERAHHHLHRQRPDAAARRRRAQGRRAVSARAQDDGDPPRDRRRRPRDRHRGRARWHHASISARARRSIIAHRRLDRQRQFPPHVRSAPDGGILRARRHALFGAGRQRRTRRHGDRRLAVGAVQLHRRDRLGHHQARPDRNAVRLREPALVSRAARCSTRRAPPACASPTGRTSSP